MHGVLRRHQAHGSGVELPELLPRLPSQLHQEVGQVTRVPGRRFDRGLALSRLSECGVQTSQLLHMLLWEGDQSRVAAQRDPSQLWGHVWEEEEWAGLQPPLQHLVSPWALSTVSRLHPEVLRLWENQPANALWSGCCPPL